MPEQAVFFMKPNSAISDVLLISTTDIISYEAELCFLIQQSRFVGVGIGLDLTKRELQSELKAKGLPWERCKAFDGAAVLSPLCRLMVRKICCHYDCILMMCWFSKEVSQR